MPKYIHAKTKGKYIQLGGPHNYMRGGYQSCLCITVDLIDEIEENRYSSNLTNIDLHLTEEDMLRIYKLIGDKLKLNEKQN